MNMMNVKLLEASVMKSQSIICCNSVMIIATLVVLFIIKVSKKAIFLHLVFRVDSRICWNETKVNTAGIRKFSVLETLIAVSVLCVVIGSLHKFEFDTEEC